MRKLMIAVALVSFLCLWITPFAAAQEPETLKDIDLGKGWSLGPSITVPPLMLRESTREGAKLDAVLVAGIGGGIALVYGGEEERTFTFSPFTIIMSGNMSQDTANEIDIAYAMTVGFFNDLVMTGFAYQLGNNVVEFEDGEMRELSRWMWLLGFGVSFGGN